MKKLETILLTVLSTFIVCGAVFALTYTDVSLQKTETQEVAGEMVEVNIATPDEEKDIKKEWQEMITDNFNIQDKKRDLENALNDINNAIDYHNAIIDELEAVKTSLTLDITIPSKIQVVDLILKE